MLEYFVGYIVVSILFLTALGARLELRRWEMIDLDLSELEYYK